MSGSRRGQADYCDQLFRKLIRERDRVCQMCGGEVGLQAAHFFGRRHFSVRWDPDNAALLCSGPGSSECHRRFDANELEKGAWVAERLGIEGYRALIERRNCPWDKQYDTVRDRLHAQLAEQKL